MRSLIVPAILLGTLVPCLAQDAALTQRHYPEDMRQDLEVMRSTFHQSHPDPYRYHTKAELDRTFEEVSEALAVPLGTEEYIRAVLPIFRKVGDAHTWISPPKSAMAAYQQTEPLIPIKVAIINDELYVDEELKGFRSVASGSRVLTINGREATSILATLRQGLIADGGDTTLLDRRIELEFPVLYRRLVERAQTFEVAYLTQQGERATQQLFALNGDQMADSYTPKGVELLPWRLEEMVDIRTAWLTLGTLDRAVLEREGMVPERFLGTVVDVLRKNAPQTLVIDVRGAGGIDLAMAEEVFSLIALQPYRVVSAMSVRSTAAPDSYKYSAPAEEFYASVGGAYMRDLNGVMLLRPDDPRLEPVKPLSKAYQGKVYVICDGLTREAGAALVMLAKRTGRGRIVGEETGSNASSFCGGRELEITLPRTGCVVHVPLTRFTPDGAPSGPLDRGEMPHHWVTQQASGLARNRDTVREALLEMIRELQ